MRFVLLALLPACSLYFDSAHGGGGGGGGATFVKVKAIGGEHTVAGIDSDDAGGIWIVYRDQVGGYYAPADVWVTHLDANGAKMSEWYYNDDYTEIGGIAYTGDALWVSYSAVGTSNAHLRKLDPATGATVGTFATMSGITDITYGGGELLLSYAWNEVFAMNPTTGALDSTITISGFPEGGTQRGIAYDQGNTWIALNFTDVLYLVDANGNIVGTATAELLPGTTDAVLTAGLQLAWDGSDLIVAVDNQIIWLAPG